MNHLLTPDNQQDEKELNTEIISLKADIEGLKLRIKENLEATCQIDEDSESIRGLREIETLAQSILLKQFEEFNKDLNKLTKDKIDLCASLVHLLDRYRTTKVHFDLLAAIKFPSSPVGNH